MAKKKSSIKDKVAKTLEARKEYESILCDRRSLAKEQLLKSGLDFVNQLVAFISSDDVEVKITPIEYKEVKNKINTVVELAVGNEPILSEKEIKLSIVKNRGKKLPTIRGLKA